MKYRETIYGPVKFILYGAIWMMGVLPGIAAVYDYYPIYDITFEGPYHIVGTPVSTATNELYAPSSLYQNADTDGVMIRDHTNNQVCEFKWTGESSTNSCLRYEQLRMGVPPTTTLLVDFDVLIPETTTNYSVDSFQFTFFMDTDSGANRIDFECDGHLGTGLYQAGVWHHVTIAADLYYHAYELRLDDVVLIERDIYGNKFQGARFNLWDQFGMGKAVYIDNLTVCTGITAKAATYDIADGCVTITDSDPHLIYGTSTVNKIIIGAGITADITISNLNVQVTNRFQSAFLVESNAVLNLKLAGSNRLESGRNRGALDVTDETAVNITDGDGNGVLTAIGGGQAPGIGGGGTITINGGTIRAIGGFGAAGIGCGDFAANSGTITIAGGTVVAQGGGMGEGGCGAGIGGGNNCPGDIITISGGTVIAIGGGQDWYSGAGIGGGYGKPGGLITISGGTVFATRGNLGAPDIGSGGGCFVTGTNIFTGGSIKTSAQDISGGATDAEGNAVFLLVVSNAVNGIDAVTVSLTNMLTGAVYSYTGTGHGDGDPHLYFYIPAGDYPAEAGDTLGFFVDPDGTSGTMVRDPSGWTDKQRTIEAFGVNGDADQLTLRHPLCTRADNFRIEGAEKVENGGWNWNVFPHTVDENGVVTVTTNAPMLMLRLRF